MRQAYMPIRRDVLVAAGVSALALLELVAGPGRADATAAAAALCLAVTVPLAWRTRAPLVSSLAACLAYAVTPLLMVPVDLFVTGVVAYFVAPFTVAARARTWRLAVTGGLLILVAYAAQAEWDDRFGTLGAVLANSMYVTLAWGAGAGVRRVEQRSRDRAARAEASAESSVRALRAEMARDLHDVVAHALSVVAVQAGGARAVIEDDPRLAAQALEDIQDVTRRALVDMRHLLDLLRDGGQVEDTVRRPGLDRLEEMVEPLRRAGVRVELQREGEPAPLSPGTETTAMRVVQEALTNVLRHSRATSACVAVRWRREGLELSVADDGVGGPRDGGGNDTGGHGLVGMRERVDLLDGKLDVAPRPGGGWSVTAWLPLPARVPS